MLFQNTAYGVQFLGHPRAEAGKEALNFSAGLDGFVFGEMSGVIAF